MILRAAVAGVLLLTMGAASPVAAAPVVVLAAQTITADPVYEDATIVVAGTVIVEGSLTIRRSRVIAAPGSRLVVDGGLTTLDVTADGLGVVVRGSASMTRTSLAHSAGDLLTIDGGSLAASQMSLTAAGILALRADDATIVAEELTIDGANGYGIRLADSSLTVSGLSISTATDYGFFAQRSALDVEDSTFTGHCGVYLESGTTGSIEDSSFRTIDRGLTLYDTGAVSLRDLDFDGGSAALSAVSANFDVTGLSVSGAEQAVVGYDAGGSIDGGRLDADTAVALQGPTTPVLRSLDLSSSTTGVRNDAAAPVDARWNWWGGAPGSGGAAGYTGPVSVSPWLTAAP